MAAGVRGRAADQARGFSFMPFGVTSAGRRSTSRQRGNPLTRQSASFIRCPPPVPVVGSSRALRRLHGCAFQALFPRHSSVSHFHLCLQISKCYYFTLASGSRPVFISVVFFSHVHGEMLQNGRSWPRRRICTLSVLCTALLIQDPIMMIT